MSTEPDPMQFFVRPRGDNKTSTALQWVRQEMIGRRALIVCSGGQQWITRLRQENPDLKDFIFGIDDPKHVHYNQLLHDNIEVAMDDIDVYLRRGGINIHFATATGTINKQDS